MVGKCPECQTILTNDDWVDEEHVDPKGDGVGYEMPVYNCPKCDIDFNGEELDESIFS